VADSDELCQSTLSEVAGWLKSKKVSPVELLDAVQGRIERLNPTLNAFITLTLDEAAQEARQAESEIAKGQYRGPLHGVPVSLKDLYATRGVRTTAGSKILADWVPDHDSDAAERLRHAGALLIGKTNMHEFALGSTTINPHYGTTPNPWNSRHVSGGSSGGSAAAVAAGLGHASMGSDTGGSIRQPAAFCGVVGMKPTYGLVSRHGVFPAAWSLDHAGPLVRSVRDAALVLNTVAGHDPRDPASVDRPPVDYTAGLERRLSGMRLGVAPAYVSEDVAPDVQRAFWDAVRVFERLGAKRVDLELRSAEYAAVTTSTISGSEVASTHSRWSDTQLADYGEDSRRSLAIGRCLTAGDYLKAQRARRAISSTVSRELESVDAFVWPTTARPASPIEEGGDGLRTRPNEVLRAPHVLTRLANLMGVPAISMPCGFTSSGLPVGITVAAKAHDDATALRVAQAYQLETEWEKRRPVVQE